MEKEKKTPSGYIFRLPTLSPNVTASESITVVSYCQYENMKILYIIHVYTNEIRL